MLDQGEDCLAVNAVGSFRARGSGPKSQLHPDA